MTSTPTPLDPGHETRLRALGLTFLPKGPPKPSVDACVEVDGMLYVSGHGPEDDAGNLLFRGRVGAEVSLDEAVAAARATGLQILRSAREHLGSLDRVVRVVKLLALVNSASDFHEQPAVVNGCSDLLVEVFGPAGRHARSAMGTSNLPGNQPVEIEAILQVRP